MSPLLSVSFTAALRRGATPFVEGPGEPSGDHPRTFLQATGDYTAANIRSQLLANTNGIRTRWQTTINAFWHASSNWSWVLGGSYGKINAGSTAIGAMLTAVRTATDDLGINWGPSTTTTHTWQQVRDAVIASADWLVANPDGEGFAHMGVAFVYDLLYDILTPTQRTNYNNFILLMAEGGPFVNGRWDDQSGSEHYNTAVCCLAADTGDDDLKNEALAETQDWADARIMVAPIAYEWKAKYPTCIGAPSLLWMFKHAMGLTDAETTDKCVYHLQNVVQFWMQNTIAHPGRDVPFCSKNGMSEPSTTDGYRELNSAAAVLWFWTLGPGKMNLDATADERGLASFATANQTTLANSENNLMGYLRTYWDYFSWDHLMNSWRYTETNESTTTNRPQCQALWNVVPVLIANTQKPTAVSATTAGIPLVRRWWPGTLDITTVRSGLTLSNSSDSLISYWHRKYYVNNYEGSARHCGLWQAHRAGPLLVHRGTRGHGIVTRHWTKSGNGTVSIVDPDLYPRYTYHSHEGYAAGGQRIAGNNSDYWTTSSGWRGSGGAVLENAAVYGNTGTQDAWYASSKVLFIRSDLTNSYSNDTYNAATATNDSKVTTFTRDFVVIQRNGDGTTREKIFTYDRIGLKDNTDEPRYNINPGPPQVTIDGTETPQGGYAPQGAVPAVSTDIQPISDAVPDGMNGDGETPPAWFAGGPTEWHYTGSSYIEVHNTTEPAIGAGPSNKLHTQIGNGRARVNILIGGNAASPTGFTIRKNGGTAATRYSGGSPAVSNDGCPQFGEWHGWAACDDNDWGTFSDTGQRSYVGMYNCQIVPNTIVNDTRYLIATEIMAGADTPAAAAKLTSDAGSVVARCGNTAVVFSVSSSGHTSGNAVIPSDVTLVVFVNFPPNAARTITANSGLTITSQSGSPAGTSSNTGYGVVEVVVSGAGNIVWS
jgi:hypothetical protein